MADYYTEYSFYQVLPSRSRAVVEMILNNIEFIQDCAYENASRQKLIDNILLDSEKTEQEVALAENAADIVTSIPFWTDEGFNLGEDVRIEETDVLSDSFAIWFHDWQGSSMETVIELCFSLLRFSNAGIEYSTIINWANTCSKPRTDAFSGGAALITPYSVTYFNPENMAMDELKRIKESLLVKNPVEEIHRDHFS